MIDEESAEKASLATLRRQLGKRDQQTQELQRQLLMTRQLLWQATEDAKAANSRLQGVLTNSSSIPAAHAEQLVLLEKRVQELSREHAEAKAKEMQWCVIAKRQRAFFLQSERAMQEQTNPFRRHPAGEIFLAPAPLPFDEDSDRGAGNPWDVGSSHANPYVCDSWPFEPNSSATRNMHEQTLPHWDEDEEEDEGDEGASEWSNESLRRTTQPRLGGSRLPGPPPPTLPSLPPLPPGQTSMPPLVEPSETSRSH